MRSVKKVIAAFISSAVLLLFAMPSVSLASEQPKTVRVGWYESPFNITGEDGSRSGYAYEFQRKVASYTGWHYEYVEGTWIELLHMLERGEIDLLSDVSYTEERAKSILYPSIPMGQEAYYIYTTSGNTELEREKLSTLNGKRVGITEDSIQAGIFREWETQRGINAQIIELNCSEYGSMQMLMNGELDAVVSSDSYGDAYDMTPFAMIGSSEFFFAVSSSRPDLLTELDSALFAIQEEDRYFSQNLYEKYLDNTESERYMSPDETEWLEEHGPIRIGYQDNYMAFCASDPSTGELTGALSNYLDYASSRVVNSRLEFEAVSFPTANDAITALQNGEIDCMFPANMTAYDSETMGLVRSSSIMKTEMLAVVRSSEKQSFSKKEQIAVAVNEGNPNYELFLKEHYPDCTIVHYADTPACLKGVSRGEADCVIISNYRFNNISTLCEKLNLTTVQTGIDLDYHFVIREGDTTLYSIMAKVTGMVPDSVTNSALNYYSSEDVKLTGFEFIYQNLGTVMTVVAVILLVILILSWRSIHLERKAYKEKLHVKDLNHRANYDALTSVRNKGAFTEYMDGIQNRIKDGEVSEVAVCICDCNDLKTINDKYGHNKGDEYITNACHFICTTFRRSAVFRVGGDEFAVVMMNDDFTNRESLIDKFHKEQYEISKAAYDPWNQLYIAIGMAEYAPDKDRSINDTLKRADKRMYENKKVMKGGAVRH